MTELEALRSANPHIHIFSIHDPEFSLYGNALPSDTTEICDIALQAVEMPDSGSAYAASLPALEESAFAKQLQAQSCGELDEQVGICYGHSNYLNALEWHTCNEFNVAVQPLVLLLAKKSDLDAQHRLDSAKVKAFYLAKGDMVEVYSDTLHFCPCEVSRNGFGCIVGLQRGTNTPLSGERSGRLWAKNKWLIAHEQNEALLAKGVVPGIYGENWKINTID